MRLFTIAEGIQPFLDKERKETLENIYKTLLTERNLYFLRDIISPDDFPVLVFCTYQIYLGNRNSNIQSEIENNLFFFNVLEFGDSINDVECEYCDGRGSTDCDNCDYGNISCGTCDESGMVECTECGGERTVPCDTCDGTGEDEEGESCTECDGSGKVTCDECDGGGKSTCQDCDGDGETSCNECGGDGSTTCDECYGRGSTEVTDSIPVNIEVYASYNRKLKDSIEIDIMRNNSAKEYDITNEAFLLFVKEKTTSDWEGPRIMPELEGQEHFGEIKERSETKLSFSINKIVDYDLDEVPERFMN